MENQAHCFTKIFRENKQKLVVVLIALCLISMALNVYLGWKIVKDEGDVPHVYMLTSFAFKYPDCANKLIDELGIDNVKVRSADDKRNANLSQSF